MATTQATMDYILEQIGVIRDAHARKMFGEYALYVGTKVVALVCDDTLFLKPTREGEVFMEHACTYREPYRGAKPYLVVEESLLEDRERISELILLTAESLPEPKPKKKKTR